MATDDLFTEVAGAGTGGDVVVLVSGLWDCGDCVLAV
jgi:hypothetical protein